MVMRKQQVMGINSGSMRGTELTNKYRSVFIAAFVIALFPYASADCGLLRISLIQA